jgi:lysophospholipase L1-like esterase
MLFFNLLLDGKRPDVAIFLDGLNDFHQPGSSWSRAPFFAPAIRWMFEQPYTRGIGDLLSHTNLSRVITRSFGERKLSDAVPAAVISENYSLPGGVSRAEAFRTIAESYTNNVTSTLRLCKANGVTCLFFLQPVPFVNYDRSRENISMRGDQPEYKTGYEQIKAKLRAVENFHSLDDAFVSPPELPYVDAVHYSPYGNHALADLIYHRLRDQLGRGK